ncbi:unnamed protein product [Caenorhabditis sp. 36 PRJEB53466]|nr:unnamed protein product [Caenorhabditis sp. 36 PRJEB53466]
MNRILLFFRVLFSLRQRKTGVLEKDPKPVFCETGKDSAPADKPKDFLRKAKATQKQNSDYVPFDYDGKHPRMLDPSSEVAKGASRYDNSGTLTVRQLHSQTPFFLFGKSKKEGVRILGCIKRAPGTFLVGYSGGEHFLAFVGKDSLIYVVRIQRRGTDGNGLVFVLDNPNKQFENLIQLTAYYKTKKCRLLGMKLTNGIPPLNTRHY